MKYTGIQIRTSFSDSCKCNDSRSLIMIITHQTQNTPLLRHQWPSEAQKLSGECAAYYCTGVQIVSCTLSDNSVLSESTGLFNPVLCVSQWNLFWQKYQPIRLCLSSQVRPGREWFPSPLGDFNRLFEGLIGGLFKIWHWNMFFFFF